MSNLLDTVAFSLSVTAPIFIIMILGVVLYRLRIINDNFTDVASKLVFNITLPALLFINISKTPMSEDTNYSLVIYAICATIVTYILLEISANYLVHTRADRGVYVQGAFRSNMGIIGLAYCVNAYGDQVFSVASIYLGGVVMLYNFLSVISLNRSMNANKSLTKTLIGIFKSPLVIAIGSALLFSKFNLHLPATIHQVGSYFSQMTLPLALLCAGATLNVGEFKKDIRVASYASIGKLIAVPFLITFVGILLGYRGMELGVMFLLSSSPAASAGYIIVRAMGGNASLSANIIVLTTVGSILSTSVGITILKMFELI
ncbi:AEC family transporter [Marinomonas balearica]|uniref:Transporter n=1 Tax=Marinomonas balearica TaxID=491947 RepID=A0A4R6MD86_9GAMM|nr:AEC family transporter [Marinomonas balearica]TDO99641.1 hypothetical protein DFP79_0628 [Marinomonas balearica]